MDSYNDDRFLSWSAATDTISDKRREDATIQFNDSPALTNVTPPGGWPNTMSYDFNAGNWTANEIWSADVAFSNLHRVTLNTRLLAMPNDSEYTFTRRGQQTSGDWDFGGQNDGAGNITVGQLRDATIDLDTMMEAIYHEVGHSWDNATANDNYNAFLGISGWVRNPPDTTGLTMATGVGTTWWYNSTARFARDYGRLSPGEDWCTTWETYFMQLYHSIFTNTLVRAKWDNLELLFADLRS